MCLFSWINRKKIEKKIEDLKAEIEEKKHDSRQSESYLDELKQTGREDLAKKLEVNVLPHVRNSIRMKEKELEIWRASLSAFDNTKA
jgi:hypothetical protein